MPRRHTLVCAWSFFFIAFYDLSAGTSLNTRQRTDGRKKAKIIISRTIQAPLRPYILYSGSIKFIEPHFFAGRSAECVSLTDICRHARNFVIFLFMLKPKFKKKILNWYYNNAFDFTIVCTCTRRYLYT